jgi:hypothetical protein
MPAGAGIEGADLLQQPMGGGVDVCGGIGNGLAERINLAIR